MKKLNKVQEELVLVDGEFKTVEKELDITRIKERIKELLKYQYRYNSIKNDKLFLEVIHICKVSYEEYEPLFEKVEKIGNQDLVLYKNCYFEKEEPIYFIVGCTGLIAGFVIIDDKIVMVKRSEYALVNQEFYEKVMSYIIEKYNISEFDIEEIEEKDETRKDYGIKQDY